MNQIKITRLGNEIENVQKREQKIVSFKIAKTSENSYRKNSWN